MVPPPPGMLLLTPAAMPVTGANGIVGDTASTPTTSEGIAGVSAGANANGTNGAAWTFTNGSGAFGDTIANSELLKGVAVGSRLHSFLTKSYANQDALDAAWAALGGIASGSGGYAFHLVTAGPGVPTAIMSTTGFTGTLRISISHTVGA